MQVKIIIKTANRSYENVAQFIYLGMKVTNKHSIKEEIKKKLKSGIACYHLAQELLSSHLLSKNVKIRTCKTNLVCGCETWSPTLREEHTLRVLRLFVLKRDEVTGGWRELHNEMLHSFKLYY
jgi:hypothetical protein